MKTETSLQDPAIKKWRFFMFFWPLLCFVFVGIAYPLIGLISQIVSTF